MITTSQIGLEEVVETLTGYEEQHIEQRFGATVGDLLELKPMTGLRSVAVVLVTRDLESQDIKDPRGKAYKHVMEMTIKQVNDFFPDDVDEVNPDQPVTDAGKEPEVVE